MNERSDHSDIFDLLVLLLENDLTDPERNTLIRWTQTDPDAVAVYHDYLRDYSIVSHQISDGVEYGPSFDTEFDQALWSALSAHEKAAPPIDIPEERPQHELIQKVERQKTVYKISRSSIITVILSTAAIFIFSFVYFLPPRISHEPVATILRSTDSQWHQGKIPANASVLMKGPLEVTQGTMMLAMYDGTTIVLQAPASVQLEQINQLYLEAGQLQATVPPDARGFTVRTPHGSVVDYGTEFSVAIDPRGTTLVEVFRGIVELRDSSNPLLFNNSQKLMRGQKGQIDATGMITWTDPVGDADDEIRVQWQCPDTVGMWDDPSCWSEGLIRGPDIVAEFKAEGGAKTILVDTSITGDERIYARRADVGLVSRYPVTVQMNGGQVQLEQLWVGRVGLNDTAEGRWIMSDGELILKGRDAVLLFVGDECNGVMEINGGSVEIFGQAKIGWNADRANTLRVKSGNGMLTINGGRFRVKGHMEVAGQGAVGTIHLNGGQMHVFDIKIRNNGSFIISGGELIIEGDKTASILSMIDAALMKSPDHDILVEYDEQGTHGFGPDKTIVSVK